MRLLLVVPVLLGVMGWQDAQAAAPKKRVLIYMTSDLQLFGSGKKTGTLLEGVSIPYYALKDAGFDVAMGSTNGLRPPIDPVSEKDAGASGKRFLADAEAMKLFNDTVPLMDLKAADYDAVYLPGGHGALWDHLDNTLLRVFLTRIAQANKTIAALDHATVALCGVEKADNSKLLQGKKVTGFSHAEEDSLKFANVVPAYPDVVLKKCGGVVNVAGPFKPNALQDGNVITGQNPQSAEKLTQMLVKNLKKSAKTQ